MPLTSSDLTTGEYLTRWINLRRMDESTRRTYAGHIRNHLIPHLGRIRLHQLRIDHIGAMFATIAARNQQITTARRSSNPDVRASVKGQRTVGPSTMHRIRATLRKALNDAIRKQRLIEHNPAAHFELEPEDMPKARLWTDAAVTQWRATGHVPSKVMVWTPDQAGVFLDYTEEHDPDLYPLFALVLRRGPRRGEAVGIRTDQIDLTTATAVISHQIATIGYEPVYKKVKTRHGDRVVALDSDTVTDLTAYSKRRAAHKLAAGPDWPDTIRLRTPAPGGGNDHVDVDLFFRRPDGTAWHPELVSERFERHARDAGLPPVGIHDGRHGAATFTKAAGGDITEIKELLGHSTITITADIYTSLLQDLQRVTAENTAKLIPRKRRNTAA
ncbi:MAG: tyrosine-type recombinase/integrase [Micromonosporaceae bacterium]